eukprot:UN07328
MTMRISFKNVLCSQPVVDYIDEHFVPWAASVQSSQGYQMETSLRVDGYPFGVP